ncbi:MAG TPA: COX15/CtaA family protein [Acidimicrobiales bacterium]|jgi:cytochrome c oxidase assembly protein subunit 15|nr:COX15/CtaA family protein [Acidimicrobiales bacterium]
MGPSHAEMHLRELLRKRVSPRNFSRVASLAVWAMALTMVSGAAVRLTGSGLGCADWPTCANNHVVAPLQFHAWMEFGNRLVVAAVTVAIVAAVAGSLLRSPRRRDLTGLSLVLVAGVFAQILLGGETVLHHLAPQYVMSHFLLSSILLADAVVLHHRAAIPDGAASGRRWRAPAGPAVSLVSRGHRVMGRLVLAAAGTVVVLGSIVTSTGPHGGDPTAPRFAFSLHDVAQLHGAAVEVLLALTLLTLWTMHRAGAPGAVMRRGEIMLLVLVAQAGVGYTQYFTGDPALLVGIHVAGAASVVVAVTHFNLGLRAHPTPAPQPGPRSSGEPALIAG